MYWLGTPSPLSEDFANAKTPVGADSESSRDPGIVARLLNFTNVGACRSVAFHNFFLPVLGLGSDTGVISPTAVVLTNFEPHLDTGVGKVPFLERCCETHLQVPIAIHIY